MSVNTAIIVGNLGIDPELRHTQSDTPVTNLRIATTYRRGDRDEEQTEWHNVVVFGRQAENCHKYLQKGRQVYVEGRLQTRKWTDRDGHDRYTTEIVAHTVQFLGRKDDAGGGHDHNEPGPNSHFDPSFEDQDIPF